MKKLADRARCSECESTAIKPYGNGYRCLTCGEAFSQPVYRQTHRKTAGSGVIAPRTYRQQIAWDGMKSR
jgi:ribosomal protein L37AE/L43A